MPNPVSAAPRLVAAVTGEAYSRVARKSAEAGSFSFETAFTGVILLYTLMGLGEKVKGTIETSFESRPDD